MHQNCFSSNLAFQKFKMILKITLSLIVVGILYLSLTPSETLTVGNDKISHFIAYSTLMLNIGLIVFPDRKKIVIGLISVILLGVIVEVLQHFVPGRFMSIEDVYANSLGVLLGTILTFVFGKFIQRWLKKV